MSYCLNPECSKPENPDHVDTCQNCGASLVLRGRYRALQSIGQGGFGRTYRAVDTDRLNSVCVIKQFLPKLQDKAAIEKATNLFNQEAIRLYELGVHPQIPNLLAFFVEEGRQYLVQDFIPGNNLLKELELEREFTEAKIWALWRDILPVLDFVHERQVIHRDIKPENIIRREPDHRLILIDFGVAKVLDTAAWNSSGTTIGSPGYMPMELLVDGKVYPASDLYGLGITSFHLLTMVSPHKLFIKYGFSWLAKWRKCLKKPVSSIFAQVLDKLLQEDHTLRYQTANEVLEDIQRLAGLQGISDSSANKAVKKTTIQSTPVPDRDQQFIEDFLRDLNPTSDSQNLAAAENIDISPVETDSDGVINSILHDIQSAVTYIETDAVESIQTDHDVANALDDELIDQFLRDIQTSSVSETSFFDEKVDVATQIGTQIGNTQIQEWACIRTIDTKPTGVGKIEFSSDRKTLISAGEKQSVKSWDLSTGKLIKTIIDPDSCATCSGTGKVQRMTRMLVVETVQNGTCPDCEGFGKNPQKSEKFSAIAFNILGKSLAIATPDHKIKLFELPSGKLLQYWNDIGNIVALALSPNGQILVSGSSDRNIKIWHLAKERSPINLTGHQGGILALLVCFDNQTLISASSDKTIKVWNMKSGQLLRTLVGHQKAITTLALSPDGQQLASGSHDHMVKLWNWQTGKHLLNLEGHSSGITALSFSSDGLPLLASGSSDGAINIWHLGRTQLVNILVDHNQRINALSFSPNGQILVSGSGDQTLKIWRVF
jgi:WD40 repeat protein/tRNA A-37 threonylcarbamoyl transferase component Bud32